MADSGRFPVARYLVALPVAALAFMALAILDQRETFLSAFGSPALAPPAASGPTPESDRAVAAVRELAAALEEAYRDGSVGPLARVAIAPPLRAELDLELGDPRLRQASAGLELGDFELLSVEPVGDGGWQVTTDETWSAADGKSRHRLRFRYALSARAAGLRIDEMLPILPEPVRASGR